mgnify:CR=1 FL=1
MLHKNDNKLVCTKPKNTLNSNLKDNCPITQFELHQNLTTIKFKEEKSVLCSKSLTLRIGAITEPKNDSYFLD